MSDKDRVNDEMLKSGFLAVLCVVFAIAYMAFTPSWISRSVEAASRGDGDSLEAPVLRDVPHDE